MEDPRPSTNLKDTSVDKEFKSPEQQKVFNLFTRIIDYKGIEGALIAFDNSDDCIIYTVSSDTRNLNPFSSLEEAAPLEEMYQSTARTKGGYVDMITLSTKEEFEEAAMKGMAKRAEDPSEPILSPDVVRLKGEIRRFVDGSWKNPPESPTPSLIKG